MQYKGPREFADQELWI